MYNQEYVDQLIYLIGLKEVNLQMKMADVLKLSPIAQQYVLEQKNNKEIEDMERMKRFFNQYIEEVK